MASPQVLTVYDPTVAAQLRPAVKAPRPRTLDGKVLGLLGNRKRNADKLLDAVLELLMETAQLRDVVVRAKNSSSRPLSMELRDELVERCDVVILAVGDCGSCSSCSVYDAIELEKMGVPTTVLVTAPFLSSAEAMSEVCGMPDYRVAVVSHPIGSLTSAEIREKAKRALPSILDSILDVGVAGNR